MKNIFSLLLVGLFLTSCSTIEFYSPQVNAQWTSIKVNQSLGGTTSAEGVSVRFKDDDYSSALRIGSFFTPIYQGNRRETWTAEGPQGYQATIEFIQTGLKYEGPVNNDLLTVTQTDSSQAKLIVRLTDNQGVLVSRPVSTPEIDRATLGSLVLKPYYTGQAGGTVTDYQNLGLITGYQIFENQKLLGFLSTMAPPKFLLAPGATLSTREMAVALALMQTHFSMAKTHLAVEGQTINFFGLNLPVHESDE
ncbi:MAG: hypothetical protein HKM05_09340 [Spirochaetales bacterium]|nr:hypothetical protein [Spirochaetales bacterium]